MKPIRIPILILFLVLVCSAWAAPPKLVFHGNREFSASELAALVSIADSSAASEPDWQRLADALTDSLVARDYLFAGVDSVRTEIDRRHRTVVHVYLREGSLARVAVVRWTGDSLIVPAYLSKRMLCATGSVFHWTNITADTDLLLTFFENSGYPFARVDIQRIETDSAAATVDVWFTLHAGPITAIDYVSFPGNKLTKESYLARETRLKLHRPYDQRRVKAAQQRLTRLDFVRRVGASEIAVNREGQTGIRFPIEEARSTRLDIAAGYLPATGSNKAVLSGLVNVEFLNLFGGGRRARVHWERPNNRIQAVEVAYREPWILNQPLAVRIDFGQRIEDTLYVTRKFAGRVEVELPSRVSGWTSIQQEAILADSLSSVQLNLPDSRTTYVEAGISFDSRDHPTNPRSGVYFSTLAGTAWRHRDRSASGLAAGSFRQQRGGIDMEVAQEFLPFWITDFSVHARGLTTDEPEVLLPDLYRLGGARTLRGYREEQFLGSRIGWASVEARYWLGPASRFFVFGDIGSAYREQSAQSQTLVKIGAGFGIRLETNLGIWGIDYGVGEGDKLLSGKLHISLLSTF
jgi:outer membrane protein insertion porin family